MVKTNGTKPTVVDLFAGAGGMSYGFKQAGFRVLLATDVNPNCEKTYTNNFPDTPYLLSDIRNLSGMELIDIVGQEIDVVVGGPACQGFSMANKRTRNSTNPKNELVCEFIRIVKELKPSWFIMENVEGILHLNNGFFKNYVINHMRRHGYKVDFVTLCSADYGVPQLRKRVFFMGNNLGSEIVPPKKKKMIPVSVIDAIGDLPSIDNRTTGHEICDYPGKAQTKYQRKMRGRSKKIHNHIITASSDLVLERYANICIGKNWSVLPNRLKSNSVREKGGHSYLYRRLHPNNPANTIANYRKAMLIHPHENRGLSVREAARLQSFDDSFRFNVTITHQQQQLANVVPPLVAKAIAEQTIRGL